MAVEIKNVEHVEVTPSSTPYRVNVTIADLDNKDIMGLVSIEEVIEFFGATELLDSIGSEAIQNHIDSQSEEEN